MHASDVVLAGLGAVVAVAGVAAAAGGQSKGHGARQQQAQQSLLHWNALSFFFNYGFKQALRGGPCGPPPGTLCRDYSSVMPSMIQAN